LQASAIHLSLRSGAAKAPGHLGIVLVLVAALHLNPIASVFGQDIATIHIAYLEQRTEKPPALSNLQWMLPPEDEGVQGARLAIEDNNTTGRFVKQRYVLDEYIVPVGGDLVAAFRRLHDANNRLVIANLTPEALDVILDRPAAEGMLIFNSGVSDDRFRNQDCRAFLLHTLPSRAMLADALAQYLVKKNWKHWFLVSGTRPEDALFAGAIQRSAQRFGAKIVTTRTWTHDYDARRTAEGEVPIFTQAGEYDVLIVADEAGVFGEYFPYRTWKPRPVAGTQGLVPTAWHKTIEQWGGAQMQRRFQRIANRWMTAKDYAAWVAVRTIGEAATRTGSADYKDIKAFILDEQFELAGFKGRPLSYRSWNGQLRQPIPVTAARALVTLSPQQGFLHQHTELDTLGYDEPECVCRFR